MMEIPHDLTRADLVIIVITALLMIMKMRRAPDEVNAKWAPASVLGTTLVTGIEMFSMAFTAYVVITLLHLRV